MALKPGDRVTSTCEQVGNFPFALLDNPNALYLDRNRGSKTIDTPNGTMPIQHSIPLASLKQEYVDLFEDNGLKICDTNEFAKFNTPLRIKLGQPWLVAITSGYGYYDVSAVYQYAPFPVFSLWYYNWLQSREPSYPIKVPASSGAYTFDLYQGAGVWVSGTNFGAFGKFYTNRTFSCIGEISYSVQNLGAGTNGDESIITATITLTFANDGGVSVLTDTQTSVPGGGQYPGVLLNIPRTVISQPWIGDDGREGILEREAGFSITVSVQRAPLG